MVGSYLDTNHDREELRQWVTQLEATYPGNEWVEYWRSKLS